MDRRSSRGNDLLWLTLAGLFLALGVASVIFSIRDGSYDNFGPIHAVLLLAFVVMVYWLVAGAWRRTSWGQRRKPRVSNQGKV